MTVFDFFSNWGFLVTNAVTVVATLVWMKMKITENEARHAEHIEEDKNFHNDIKIRMKELEKEQQQMDRVVVEIKTKLDMMYKTIQDIERDASIHDSWDRWGQ